MAMSLDRRLREAFDRIASTVDPDIDLNLERTLERSARPLLASALGPLMAASVATVALVIGVRLLMMPIQEPGGPSAAPVGPSQSDTMAAVAGAYTVTLVDADPGVATADLTLAGTWSITLGTNGVMELVPPPTFEGSRAAGHTFNLDATTLRTDLYYNDYCNSIGTYTWAKTGDTLILTVVEDDCAIRRTLLATRALVSGN
jgi:hypothetical protein